MEELGNVRQLVERGGRYFSLTQGRYSPAKLFCISRFSLLNDMNEVISKNKRYSLSFNAEFRFEIPENMSKIYVEEL